MVIDILFISLLFILMTLSLLSKFGRLLGLFQGHVVNFKTRYVIICIRKVFLLDMTYYIAAAKTLKTNKGMSVSLLKSVCLSNF